MQNFWAIVAAVNGILAVINLWVFATEWDIGNLLIGLFCVIGAYIGFGIVHALEAE